jgi:hypothetical protein
MIQITRDMLLAAAERAEQWPSLGGGDAYIGKDFHGDFTGIEPSGWEDGEGYFLETLLPGG